MAVSADGNTSAEPRNWDDIARVKQQVVPSCVTRDDRNEVSNKALTWTLSNISPHPAMLATLRTTNKNKGDDTNGSHSWNKGISMTVKVLVDNITDRNRYQSVLFC